MLGFFGLSARTDIQRCTCYLNYYKMRLAISLSAVLIACMVRATYNLDCEQNQNGQSMSFFKTNGDLLLTGFFDVYDEKCSGPTSTGIHSMEMVATVVQILNSIHYIPGITLGLTLYEVCSYRSSDLQKALISFVVDKDCNNSTTPIAIYTTEDIRAKISPSIGLDIPIITAGPIIDVDIHAEAAVKFLIVNNIDVADVLVAQDLDVAQRFESVAKDNGLCLNRTVLAQNLGNLNDSSVVIVMTNKNIIKSIIESSSSVRVSHFIIIPLDGPLPPKPEQDIFEYPAHIFAIADSVHHSMKMHRQDYCTVISGESGSGKTKASKVIMKYIAAVTNLTGQQEVERVKNILIQSNIILETFGNAKTNRNDNSSRFGKYMDINFDFKGDPIGGRVINYLLEKSRVIQQQLGERNFHSFYQALGNTTHKEASNLGLNPDPQHYFYTRQGKSTITPADKSDFQATLSACKTLGFSATDIKTIWKIVAAILQLGNVTFSTNDDDSITVTNFHNNPVEQVSKLLEVDAKDLLTALSKRIIAANGELLQKAHTLSQAEVGRDALAKAIYDRLFTWIVSKVNEALIPYIENDKYKGGTVIGVLDIYGFEVFEQNSFEQFCINYCNEKLQQVFIDLVLRQEQEEYKKEGIAWQEVKYFNNQVICDLVEKPHQGVIAIMDEACLNVGKVNDEMLLEAMDSKLSNHKHYSSRQVKTLDKDLKHKTQFKILHYAGDVVYNIYGFLEKNKDTLFQDFKRLLYSSKNPIIRDMWPEGALDIKSTTKRPVTAGSAFKISMIALVKTLNSKMPYYVRCIKPNENKAPVGIDYKRVVHQVSYLGLLENVRVRRAGFAHRQPYNRFLKRYKMISGFTWPNYKCSDKEATRALIDENHFSNDVKYGVTKLFIRSPQTLFALEKMRAELIPAIVILLQKQWRGAICRAKFRKMKAAYFIIKFYRRHKIRTYLKSVLEAHRTCENNMRHRESIIWPHTNFAVRQLEPSLRYIYKRWKAYKLLSPYPRSEWPQLRCKVYAASLLWGKRPSWGAKRMWRGDYLSSPTENPENANYTVALNNLKNSDRFNQVLFSSFIYKMNRYNKCADRAILITDWAVYKLDIKNFKPMKKGMPIQEVTGMSVSPGQDQLVVIHSNRGNDFVVTLKPTADINEDRIGELLGVISTRYFQLRNSELPVNVSNKFNCMLGKKSRMLRVEVNPQTSTASFRKDDNGGIVYIIPPNVAVHPFIKA